jgi:preprotein translocase subunit SecF
MAVAAMVALLHDLVVTVGIYSLVGFEVTPATVIGFLTILGYSLYDTVVVFDKVRENTAGMAGGSRMTYSQAANLAVNQTLVRSINTSLIALLPISAILFTGVTLLGTGPLKDLSLALFVGVATGAYSSIFIATPLLATLKEREPAMQALARRVAGRQGGAAQGTVAARRAAARSAGEPDDPGQGAPAGPEDAAVEPATTGAGPVGGAARAARPARSGAGAQRAQPKRSGKSRPGGKKRR